MVRIATITLVASTRRIPHAASIGGTGYLLVDVRQCAPVLYILGRRTPSKPRREIIVPKPAHLSVCKYSYPEDSSVAHLDLLGLREHCDGIGSQQPHCG
jgi:hypothetical protein